MNIPDEVLTTLWGVIVLGLTALSLYLRKHISELKKQVTPNGGKSMYDQTTTAMDLSRKALEMAVLADGRLKGLEVKVDALILASVPKGKASD